jgi:hypothetical protein
MGLPFKSSINCSSECNPDYSFSLASTHKKKKSSASFRFWSVMIYIELTHDALAVACTSRLHNENANYYAEELLENTEAALMPRSG